MAKAGRRKPRKRTSSKSGASRVPKAATSQMSDGVRKKSSMGMFLGREMREEMAWTETDRMRPMGMRRRALGRAVAGFGGVGRAEGGWPPGRGREAGAADGGKGAGSDCAPGA